MKRCLKLDVRIDLFDETSVTVMSDYAPVSTKFLQGLADLIRKHASDHSAELLSDLPAGDTAVIVRSP